MGVAQLVERRVVVADAAGSSPVTHPKFLSGRRPINPYTDLDRYPITCDDDPKFVLRPMIVVIAITTNESAIAPIVASNRYSANWVSEEDSPSRMTMPGVRNAAK